MRRASVRASSRNSSSTRADEADGAACRPIANRCVDEGRATIGPKYRPVRVRKNSVTASVTMAMIAIVRNARCHSGGSMSDDTANAAKTPTPTTLMMPMAVRSSTEAAAETVAGTWPEQQHHAQRLAGDAANGEVGDAVGGESDAEDPPVRRTLRWVESRCTSRRRAAGASPGSAAAPVAAPGRARALRAASARGPR